MKLFSTNTKAQRTKASLLGCASKKAQHTRPKFLSCASKKAQIEMQFNWVFVLIVGVVILGFFFTIISNQNKKANVENAQDLIETLDSVFNTIYVNPNTVNTFHITKARLDFACEQGLSEYYIQGTGPVDTSKDIIFTPYTLRGNTIITWTSEWKVPFESGVFTYMANDMTIFVFVNDSKDIWELYQEMPDAFEKILFTTIDYQAKIPQITGYDRIVIISDKKLSISNFGGDTGVHTREISSTNGLLGSVTFDQGTTSAKIKQYYTKEMLWGAIFTDDEISYDCTVDKAVEKMTYVARVLQERDEALAQELLYTNCYNYLTPAADELKNVRTNALNWKTADWDSIKTAREKLESDQELLMRGYRCPNIY